MQNFSTASDFYRAKISYEKRVADFIQSSLTKPQRQCLAPRCQLLARTGEALCKEHLEQFVEYLIYRNRVVGYDETQDDRYVD
jgi:hypothetical protein